MSNSITIFENQQFGQIRSVTQDGEPWFVAADVCQILEIQNVTQAVARLDADEKAMLNIGLRGGDTNVVNEYGLYTLVLASRKPEAKEFKRWITHEVIPTIRKHGAYMTAERIEDILLNPDTIIKLATELKAERTARLEAEKVNQINAPKVIFADAVSVSHSTILIGDLAKLLRQNGIDIGANRLFAWLRENNYLIRREGTDFNTPTQASMDMGLFSIKETVISHSDGHTSVSKTTKVTGKGQQYFINKFLGNRDFRVKEACKV